MADEKMTGVSLVDSSCRAFADELAAKKSVPGGGGAAALAGALGVALCSMVGNFTLGKKRYADVEDDVRRMMDEAEDLRHTLIGLIEADAAAFEPLSRAYGIPKEDPTRAQVLELATKTACSAPLEMMRACARSVELLEEMGEKGSRMLLSDIGCGAALCSAALRAASMNVYVNTKTLKDRAYADTLDQEVDGLLSEYVPRADALAEHVSQSIRGKE